MSKWTEELKEKAIDMYTDRGPTPENTMDIVTDVATELGMTPNGVRLVLSKAGVYVSKTKTEKEGGEDKPKKAAGGTRVSKEGAQEALREAIEAAGKTVDMDIISKLTGKAAQYFASILKD